MKHYKLNIHFDVFTVKQPFITAIISRCIEEVLEAEKITAVCEINVLVTDNKGIRAINQASRKIDSATDVLSFPMFQLEPGNPP